eukprot:432398_1
MTVYPATIREYFWDTYKFTSSARVLNVSEAKEDECVVILDKTIFHKQGGGQPSDVGTISSTSGDSVSDVTKVVSDKENPDIFLHFGRFIVGSSQFRENDNVRYLVKFSALRKGFIIIS